MLEVVIKKEEKQDNHVELGQIRHGKSSEGKDMFVLIVAGGEERYSAVLLNDLTYVRAYSFNSFKLYANEIIKIYPYVAKGKLEIVK